MREIGNVETNFKKIKECKVKTLPIGSYD